MRPILPLLALPLVIFAQSVATAQMEAIPALTQGDTLPEGAKHDWNLGPAGLRGWMYCDNLVTNDARQILVTNSSRAHQPTVCCKWGM